MVGVHRNVISIWKAKGDAEPDGPYGEFLPAAGQARVAARERGSQVYFAEFGLEKPTLAVVQLATGKIWYEHVCGRVNGQGRAAVVSRVREQFLGED
jgi:hypothetical protein